VQKYENISDLKHEFHEFNRHEFHEWNKLTQIECAVNWVNSFGLV